MSIPFILFQQSTFTYIRSVFSFDYISAPEGPKTKKDNVKPMFFSTRGPENPKRQCKTNVFQHPRTQKPKKTFCFLARQGLRNIGSALSSLPIDVLIKKPIKKETFPDQEGSLSRLRLPSPFLLTFYLKSWWKRKPFQSEAALSFPIDLPVKKFIKKEA